MPKTTTDLYCALMGDKGKLKVRKGEPDPGFLYPRFEESRRFHKGKNKWVRDQADVTYELDEKGAPVLMGGEKVIQPEGGTSLHDVPGWFNCRDFKIPTGTEYSDQIYIHKDPDLRTSQFTGASGYHYMLEVRVRMTPTTFKGYLDNMARAAIVQQVAQGVK